MGHNMARRKRTPVKHFDQWGETWLSHTYGTFQVWGCTLECGRSPAVAYELTYDQVSTQWVFVCEECQDDNTRAPYWWNKALRGEALDDEEE